MLGDERLGDGGTFVPFVERELADAEGALNDRGDGRKDFAQLDARADSQGYLANGGKVLDFLRQMGVALVERVVAAALRCARVRHGVWVSRSSPPGLPAPLRCLSCIGGLRRRQAFGTDRSPHRSV